MTHHPPVRTQTSTADTGGSIFWQRLDEPGHDAAWLERSGETWLLHGAAVFRDGDVPAWLSYEVVCDETWATLRGEIRGRVGSEDITFIIERSAAGWSLNGSPVPGLDDVLDLDLAFTPATNNLQLRRVGLAIGETAEFAVAWFDGMNADMIRLPQRYQRRTEDTYWYESPQHDYAAELAIGPHGFIRSYPGLWVAV